MKIEELNSCFDSITPTKEQKDKILAGVMSAKNEPVKVIKLNRYKYASVAAVVAVGVFAAVYSNTALKNSLPNSPTPEAEVGNLNYAVNTYDGNEEQKDIVQEYSVTENKSASQQPAEPSKESRELNTDYKGFAENLENAYPELAEENPESAPSVAMYDGENITRSVPVPSLETPIPEDVDENVMPAEENAVDDSEESFTDKHSGTDSIVSGGGSSGGSGGGGGGGTSSAYLSMQTKALSINEVMTHNVYSKLMPTVYANKFNFRTAEEQQGRLKVIFSNEQGNYMSVSIVEEGEYKFYENVIKPEEIKNIESHGYVNFAVKCGEYYVIYNVEANDVNEVYNMVISSEYFNN